MSAVLCHGVILVCLGRQCCGTHFRVQSSMTAANLQDEEAIIVQINALALEQVCDLSKAALLRVDIVH